MARSIFLTFVSIFLFQVTPVGAEAPLTSAQVANFVKSVYAVHDAASKHGPLSISGGGQTTAAPPSGSHTGGLQGQVGQQPMAPADSAAMQQAMQQIESMNISPEQKQMMLQMMKGAMQGQGAGMAGSGSTAAPSGIGQMGANQQRSQAAFTSALEDIESHPGYNDIRRIVTTYGYADLTQWALVGDRVMRAYIAIAAEEQGGQFGQASAADKMAVKPHRASIKGWESLQ